jgi:microcystin-dependent protein
MANEYYEEFKIKADEDMERLENIIYKKVDSIYDMDRNDVFYLIENDAVLGTFKIYVYDDENGASELGTSAMEITGFQMLADLDLKTTNKFIVDAINETNTNAQKLDKLIGIMENLILADVEDLYSAQQANYEKCLDLGKINELTTIDKKTAVAAINELYNEVGLLEDLNTPSNETIIDSLNSFVTSLIPPGTVLPYAGLIPPNGFLMCDGATYNSADYPFLVKAIKSDDYILTTFRVPDFRGKTFYQHSIPWVDWGDRVASIGIEHLPAHHHGPTSEYSHTHYGYTGNPTETSGECSSDSDGAWIVLKDGVRCNGNTNTSDTKHKHEMYFSTTSHTHTVTYHDTLTDQSSGITKTDHNNMQPYIGLNFIIKY